MFNPGTSFAYSLFLYDMQDLGEEDKELMFSNLQLMFLRFLFLFFIFSKLLCFVTSKLLLIDAH